MYAFLSNVSGPTDPDVEVHHLSEELWWHDHYTFSVVSHHTYESFYEGAPTIVSHTHTNPSHPLKNFSSLIHSPFLRYPIPPIHLV